jgi:hypothetical protein
VKDKARFQGEETEPSADYAASTTTTANAKLTTPCPLPAATTMLASSIYCSSSILSSRVISTTFLAQTKKNLLPHRFAVTLFSTSSKEEEDKPVGLLGSILTPKNQSYAVILGGGVGTLIVAKLALNFTSFFSESNQHLSLPSASTP